MTERKHKKRKIRVSNDIPKPYKSRFEFNISQLLVRLGVPVEYETEKIKFCQPEKKRTYTPDFKLPNGIFLEVKGRLTLEDRNKHLWIKDQHPEHDIRFVFMDSRQKIRKGSKTTYAMWCDKHGFEYADKQIPKGWLRK